MAIDKQSRNNNGQQQAWLHPPQLPPHLESVILNNFNNTENNSGALPIPNHVVLNHLATTSIKHNTLAVASIVRYKKVFDTSFIRTTTTSFTVFHNTRAATVTSDKLNPEAQDTNIHVPMKKDKIFLQINEN